MGTATMQEVDVTQKVYTADELRALRARLAGRTAAGGTPHETDPGDPSVQQPDDWNLDVDIITKFIGALDEVMRFLNRERIPEPSRSLVDGVLINAARSRDQAIGELRGISSSDDPLYASLTEEGLTQDSLLAKISTFVDDIDGGSVAAVLDGGDKVVGSLSKVIPVLGAFKEAKELVEHKIKYHGDAGLISLNLYGQD